MEREYCLPQLGRQGEEPPCQAGPLPTTFPAAIPCGGPGRSPRLPARPVPPRPTWVYGPLPAGPAARVPRAALAHLGSARTLQPPGPAAPPRRVPDDVTEAGGAVPTGTGWGPATSWRLCLFLVFFLLSSSLPPPLSVLFPPSVSSGTLRPRLELLIACHHLRSA